MGRAGFIAIAVAALMATSSAINASFYGTGRLAYIVAKSGELPHQLERTFRGEHVEGALITTLLPSPWAIAYAVRPTDNPGATAL